MTLEELAKAVDNIRLAKDIVYTESLRKQVLKNIIEAGIVDSTVSGISGTTNVPIGGGNVTHADQYDRRLRVTIDGSDYYIGLYNT